MIDEKALEQIFGQEYKPGMDIEIKPLSTEEIMTILSKVNSQEEQK